MALNDHPIVSWKKSPTADVTSYTVQWNVNNVNKRLDTVTRDAAKDIAGYSLQYTASGDNPALQLHDTVAARVTAISDNGSSPGVPTLAMEVLTVVVLPSARNPSFQADWAQRFTYPYIAFTSADSTAVLTYHIQWYVNDNYVGVDTTTARSLQPETLNAIYGTTNGKPALNDNDVLSAQIYVTNLDGDTSPTISAGSITYDSAAVVVAPPVSVELIEGA